MVTSVHIAVTVAITVTVTTATRTRSRFLLVIHRLAYRGSEISQLRIRPSKRISEQTRA